VQKACSGPQPEVEVTYDHPRSLQKHRQVARCHPGEIARMFFYIRADGTVRIPKRHARHVAQISRALLAADRRLRPLCPIAETTAPAPGVAAHEHRPNPRRWTAGLTRNDRIKALY
jgi:hypothetical protein